MNPADYMDPSRVYCTNNHQLYGFDGARWMPINDERTMPAPVFFEDESGETLLDAAAMSNLMGGSELSTGLLFEQESHLLNYEHWSSPAVSSFPQASTVPKALKVLCEHGYAERRLTVRRVAALEANSDGQATLGIFAREEIRKGDCILEYSGIIKQPTAHDDYSTIYPTRFAGLVISAKTTGGLARLINHSSEPNAALVRVGHASLCHVLVVATELIAPGKQVFIDYGAGYWQSKGISPLALR